MARIAWGLLGLVAVWVVGWLVVPPLVKPWIESLGTQSLRRQVSVGSIDFQPWSLELTVSDIAIASADGKARQLHIERVYVDSEMESLFRMAPVLDAITIDKPTLQLTHQGDGRYDIDDIIAHLAKPNEAASKSTAGEPKFALYNVTINDGSIDFTDVVGKTKRLHTLRKLNLGVPFLSNLESQRQVQVAPHLGFVLNGSVFDSAAEGTPFAQSRKGDVDLKISQLDLAPYLVYLPASLPVQLKGAVVDANVRLDFAQAKPPRVSLSGTVKVSNLKVATSSGADLLAVQSIETVLADVRPLEKQVKLASLDINAPQLSANRNRAGRINLDLGAGKAPTNATKNIAVSADSARAGGSKDDKSTAPSVAVAPSNPAATTSATAPSAAPSAAPEPAPATAPLAWKFELAKFTLRQGEVVWTDDHVQPQARLGVKELELQAQNIAWPFAAPASFEGSVAVPYRNTPARFAFKGQGTDQEGSVHATAADVALAIAAPYSAQYLEPTLAGVFQAELDATWQAGKVTLAVQRAAVQNFALQAAKQKPSSDKLSAEAATAVPTARAAVVAGAAPVRGERLATELPQFKLLEVTEVQLDLTARKGRIGKLALRSPNATARRDDQGRWMYEQWLKAPSTRAAQSTEPTATTPATPAPVTVVPATSTPWDVTLDALVVDDGVFALNDRSKLKPVRLEVSALKVDAKAIALDGKKPANINLSARVRSGRTEGGTLAYQGTAMWGPLAVQGNVQALDIPAHALSPYFADKLNIDLLRADASFKGQVRYAALEQGPQVQVKGDMALADFRANSARDSGEGLSFTEELLSWKALNVPGLQLNMNPGEATRVDVREVSLTDFYARIIINEAGRINLQDLVKQTASDAAASAAPAASSPPEPTSVPTPAPTAGTVAPSTGPAAIVQMGPVSLVNGKVLFSDRFVKPNYSANLSQLTGKLGGFSSQPVDGVVQLADLDLRGRAEGTASLEITGKLNPLAKPLAMDIKGKVRDLELPPLTPYSVKYAGYGIERGKLSVDVAYAVQPDGQLTASNKLVLNQLTFGDKVEGAPNSLPVKLAVALLADRDGVIDLDLPISGSINDPQFRIGAVIWKVITNLVVKAITSPFALLSSAFGGDGGTELSSVAFAPGSSVLQPDTTASLDKVAKALKDRPALNVTVVGTASLEVERETFKRNRLQTLVLSEKRRRATLAGQDAAAVVEVTTVEYPSLLRAAYRRADISKPRNFVGLIKELEVPEMEALLLASIVVNEESMRELALQRALAVKEYLSARDLPAERLFLGAAKTVKPEGDWKPRAELGLAGR